MEQNLEQAEQGDHHSPNERKIRGKRGTTKKPSYMATGEHYCKVCENPNPTGYHYGQITCEGCKGFFKRIEQDGRGATLKCRNNGRCLNDGCRGLRKCASCRYEKCLNVGMNPQLVKVGEQLIQWNKKKEENRKRRRKTDVSLCESGDDSQRNVCSSSEESFENMDPAKISNFVQSRKSICTISKPEEEEIKDHAIQETDLSHSTKPLQEINKKFYKVIDDPVPFSQIESIISTFKNKFRPREKAEYPCQSAEDARRMFSSCAYRSSWSDFFLNLFGDICELEADILKITILESVETCQTFLTIATGLMPGGKTLKLENDSQTMVIPETSITKPPFSVFHSMLLTAQTSIVKSLTIDDVAVILVMAAIKIGKEISTRNKSYSSYERLDSIDKMIFDHIRETKPNEPQAYDVCQDLVSICLMINCQTALTAETNWKSGINV